MQSVIYISTAVSSFSRDDLDTLVATCAERNRRDDITGCLVYNGVNFIQLLEGESDKIAACMARISGDERHTGVVTIRDNEISARECPEWGMVGLKVSQQPSEEEIREIESLLSKAGSDTQNLFTSFSSL